MLFLWIGSQNDRVFLFGNGYRSEMYRSRSVGVDSGRSPNDFRK